MIILVAYAVLTALYCSLGYLTHLESRVKGVDACYYYMYLPSIVLDGDIDFSDEVSRYFGPTQAEKSRTSTGRVGNHWPVGPAVFWAPFFLIAHAITLIGNVFGATLPSHGYLGLHTTFVYVANSMYGVLGILLLCASLRRFFELNVASLACLVVLLATPLAYYLWPFTPMSHTVSFFAVSLFIWVFLRYGIGLRTAICVGLMFLARWQDVLYCLPILFLAGRDLLQNIRCGDFRPLNWVARHIGMAALFLLTVSPQLIAWKILYGHWIMPPSAAQKIDFTHLHLIKTLFGMENGLLSWHPLLILGVIGLPFMVRIEREWGWYCSIAIALQLIFVSSLQASAGWSFGNRFLVSALPFFAFGTAALFDRMWKHNVLLYASVAVVFFFVVWNQLFVYQYQRGLIPRSLPLTWRQLIDEKFIIHKVNRSEQLYRAGTIHLSRNDYFASLEHARKADALAPGREKVILLRAVAALLCRRFNESQDAFRQLVIIDEREGLYKLGLAYACAEAGEKDLARHLVEGLNDPGVGWMLKYYLMGKKSVEPLFFERVAKKLLSFSGS